MKVYLVWNEAKTECFGTTDQQLAYEIRKGATSNAVDADGNYSIVGVAFADRWVDDVCTTEVVETDNTDEIPVKVVETDSYGDRHEFDPIK